MGRGTIVGGGENGLYTVSLDYGSSVAVQRLARLESQKAAAEAEIAALGPLLAALRAHVSALTSILDARITAYANSNAEGTDDEKRGAVDKATNDLLEKLKEVRLAEVAIETLQIKVANINSTISRLQSLVLSQTRSMWCADLTTDAEGSVATIEVNGEQPTFLVSPGGRPPEALDGAMVSRGIMSPEQVFLNAALLPGWQKWRPTFRSGTITAIDRANDTCDVALDAALSSAQRLNINQGGALFNVPIEYMNCNSGAFLVGDDVVVQFQGQNWSSPKVIGFLREPRSCAPKELAFAIEALPESSRHVVPAPTYEAMYHGQLDEDSIFNVPGLNRYSSESFIIPWNAGIYLPNDSPVKGGSYDQNDAVLRFDLALQKVGDNNFFGPGSYGGFIIRVLEVEDHGAALILPGVGQGQIASPSESPSITYFTDNRTTATTQNNDGEDITFAVGTTINGVYSAYVNDASMGELFQDAEIYDAIFRGYFSAPSSIVVIFNGKRCRYDLKHAGPIPALQNPDITFTYTPTGDTGPPLTRAYKQWLWATYEFGDVLPDAP